MQRRRFVLGLGASLALVACSAESRAHALVDEAASQLESTAYYAERVDWSSARATAHKRLDEGTPVVDVIRDLVRGLRDGHSFYIDEATVKRALGNQATDGFVVKGEMLGPHAYLTVPTFVGNVPARMAAYRDALQGQVTSLSLRSPEGWIVDLRENGGGNMGPMLLGLRPFLGTATLGSWVRRNGSSDWSTDSFSIPEIPAWQPAPVPDLQAAPVAVLAGPRTASSGEAVLVSFIGRPATRTFGAPTAGKSSGNRGIRLADGSMLLVMAALMADRTGRVYGGPVLPDEPVVAAAGAGDAVVRAARDWLAGQGALSPKRP